MQDSLKDYIKIASNIKDKKTQISLEALANSLATAEQKRKCEDYAHKIVEFLIDGKLQPEIFTRSLHFINVALYDDIVEERAISKLCGYPLCGKQIPDMPNKKYVILPKVNKVYDITERKNYCSNFCYKASSHIKQQIDDSPLWLRRAENYPTFNLLEEINIGLTPGEEIVYGIPDTTESNFTSVAAFTEASLDEAEDMEKLPEFDNADEVTFEPNLYAKVSKSILKRNNSNNPNTNGENSIEKITVMNENEKDVVEPSTSTSVSNKVENKRVTFIDDVIEPMSSASQSMKKQQEELSKSIESLCRSLNIELDLNKTDKIGCELESDETIQIDLEKMSKVIEKVNESELQRKKQTIFVDTTVNPELYVKNTNIYSTNNSNARNDLPPPKYSHRLSEKCKMSQENAPIIDHKMESVNMKTKMNARDKKMAEILEKLKIKNKRRGVILIDTVQNPEVFQTSLEDTLTKQSSFCKLNDYDLLHIKTSFRNWLTFESFLYLHGEEVIKQILSEEKLEKCLHTLKVTQLETPQQLKYVEICKKLQLKEFADKNFDKACFTTQSNELKPLPDYFELKASTKDMNLKVKAFYTDGTYGKNQSKSDLSGEDRENENTEGNAEDNVAVLPLVDVSSQNAMRRNIFNKSITKFCQNHIFELQLDESTTSKVQNFIKTFKLEANNIVFKPGQWNVIALILINCLRTFDANLHVKLDTKASQTYIKNCIGNNDKFTNNLLLNDINQIIKNVEDFVLNYITTKPID